jgi:formylmethanofuran dehydrogenase subunit E
MGDWRAREFARQLSGEYVKLPWQTEPWWIASTEAGDHYAHVSSEDPSKIAYTPDERHGREDRQLRTKPGRYLNKYFKDVLTPVDIAHWAGVFAGENERLTLRFARTPDDIESVYANGPSSCMGHSAGAFRSSEHPARMYGAGDLAVAYIAENGDPTARALCYPEKKVYGTIYGDAARLEPLLEGAGFECEDRRTGHTFYGARMLYVEQGGGFIAPYLDISAEVEIEGGYLVLCQNGIECSSTNGVTGGVRCERCEEYTHEDSTTSVDNDTWCEDCYEQYAVYCERCEESTNGDGARSVNTAEPGDRSSEETWCEYCVDNHATRCNECGEYALYTTEVGTSTWCWGCVENGAAHCERCEEYVPCEDTKQIDPGSRNEETWCEDCAKSDAFECEDCGDLFPEDEKKETDHGPHCERCYDPPNENQLTLEFAPDGTPVFDGFSPADVAVRPSGVAARDSRAAAIARAVFCIGGGLDPRAHGAGGVPCAK